MYSPQEGSVNREPWKSTIQDESPTVVMDIRLGKKHDFIDFDYDAYHRLASRIDVTPEESTKLTISFDTKSLAFGGHYEPWNNHISISTRKDEDMNNSLTHELQHVKDNSEGLKHGLRGKIGNLSMLGFLTFPIGVPLGIYTFAQENYLTTFGLGLGYTATVFMANYGYVNHPLEERARAASLILNEPVILSTKK